MTRRVLAPVAFGVLLVALAPPAGAGPKTIEKKFSANIPIPVLAGTKNPNAACSGSATPVTVPGSEHREKLTAPGPGTLKVEVTGFLGDWDIALDAAGKRVAEGDNASAAGTAMSTGTIVEKLNFKVKKAGPLEIVVCNFAGGPTGTGKYVFTSK